MVSGTASPAKDRKKSAHWTDADTETLVGILLRWKDSGRTPDNGFRPEIWKEASIQLEKSTFMGGPKTPEACKSRWQRIQRDYRAAKDIESFPGFTWDRREGRLIASPEAWKAAESQVEPYKYSKIHLTCFDTLAILCPNEPIRSRIRNKGRSSHASTSDTSSMISLSVTGSTSHLDELNQSQQGQNPNQPYHHQHPHQHQHTGGMGMPDLQTGMGGGMMWEPSAGDEDGEGEFDNFAMVEDSNDSYMHQQTRMPLCPSIMTATPPQHMMPNQQQQQQQHPSAGNSHSNGGSPPKKPRLNNTRPPTLQANHQQLYAMTMPRSPTYAPQPTLLDPAVLTSTSGHQQPPQQQQQQQHQPPNHPPPQNMMMGHHTPTSTPNLVSQMHQHQHQQQAPQQQQPSSGLPSNPHTPSQQAASANDRPYLPSPATSISAEVHHAGLSDAQRRTQAILQLQQESDLRDEDTIEVMAEFESNIAAADTYLAVKKDQLRIMYLRTIVQRRRQPV